MVAEETSPLLQGAGQECSAPWRVHVTRFSRRWDVLCLLCLLSLLQTVVWNCWGPLVLTSSHLFHWGPSFVSLLAAWGCLVPLLATGPVLLLARKSLKAFLLLTSGCLALGSLVRATTLNTEIFTLGNHLCAGLSGVTSSVLSPVMELLAFLWFPEEELRTALTISVIFSSLGPGLPFLLAGQMVESPSNGTASVEDVTVDLHWYLYSHAIPAAIFFIFTVIYFPSGSSRDRSSVLDESHCLARQVLSLAKSPRAWAMMLAASLPQAVLRAWLAMAGVSLTSVCIGQDCLTEDWVDTMVILASLARLLASVAAVRWIQLSSHHLRVTLVLIYVTATVTFLFLSLVTLQFLPSGSLVKAQISILFLFVIGYSLISSSIPLVIKLSLEYVSPLPLPPTGLCLALLTHLASAAFLCLWSLPSVPISSLHYVLPSTLTLASCLLASVTTV